MENRRVLCYDIFIQAKVYFEQKGSIMENQFSRKEISEGVFFTRYIDDRFKSNRISVIFMDRLDNQTASVNALIPAILSRSSSDYPTMRALNAKLSGLYAANLDNIVRKRGDIQLFGLYASAIDDSYAIEQEKVLSETVRLLCGCLFHPYLENGVFPEKIVEVQKQNLIDANDAELNDRTLYAYRKGTEESFRAEPAAVSVYGENERTREITPESAYAAYLDMLRTKNVEIICVGTNDFSEAEELLKQAFRSIGRKPAPRPENRFSLLKETMSSVSEPLDIIQSKLFLSFKTDHKNSYALLVMCALLGGDVSSRLFTVVREKLSLCYYCYSRFLTEKGTMIVESGMEQENLEKAKAEILRQLEEIGNGNFTAEELERIQRSMQNDLQSVNDWIGSISGWYLNRILDHKIETPEEMIQKLLAVTREEVAEAARSFRLDTVFVLTPRKENNA